MKGNCKSAVYLLLVLSMTALCNARSVAQAPPGIVFVDSQGNDGNSGLSWSAPKQTLAGAVAIAGPGTQVWVKQGLYPTANVSIGPGIYLYGGFAGNEVKLSQRSVQKYISVIDGSSGGSYNTPIFFTSDNGIPARLDGFTIQHTADAISITWGSSSSNTSPAIANNTITDSGHVATNSLGYAIRGLQCSPFIQNNIFSSNIGGCILLGNNTTSTITDNVFDSNSNAVASGGIVTFFGNSGGTIQGNTFTNNATDSSVIDGSGALAMIGNTLIGNTNTYSGGLSWGYGTVDVEGNVLSGNSAATGALRFTDCTGTVIGNTILNNTGTVGGMWSVNGGMTIANNNISGNTGSWISGFVEYYYNGGSGNDSFLNNVVANNPGTGVDWEGSAGVIANCLISGNTVGISIGNATPLVANNTIALNTDTGIAAYSTTAMLRNNILASNNVGLYAATTTPDSDYDCVWGNSGGNYTGLFAPSPHDVSANPMLNASFKPTAKSPCISAGNNSVVQASWEDLTGGSRIIGGTVDIGAYEFGSVAHLKLTFLPSSVVGGTSSTGKLKLAGPAPAGGLTITLSSGNNAAAAVPSTIAVPAGSIYAYFPIATFPVAGKTTPTITASYAGNHTSAVLSVVPVAVTSVQLLPNSVVGGQGNAMGIVTLTSPAGSAPITVTLSSNSPSIAKPTASSVTIPVGSAAATFSIQTFTVGSNKTATISANANGITKTVKLDVLAPCPLTCSWVDSYWDPLFGSGILPLEWDLIIWVNITNTSNQTISNLNIVGATYPTGGNLGAVWPVPGFTYNPGQPKPSVSLAWPEPVWIGNMPPGGYALVALDFQYLVPPPNGSQPVAAGKVFPLNISVDYPFAPTRLPTLSIPTP